MKPDNILENLVTAVIVVDKSLAVQYANPAATQLLNVSQRKLAGSMLLAHVRELGVENSALLSSAQTNQSLSINSTKLITHDGVIHTVDIMMTSLDPVDQLSLLELRQVDQQNQIYQQSNQEAQQQAAQFLVRNLAHEIKNPLGGLRGAAQLLSRELQDQDAQEFTTMIIEQADRMGSLVDRLLGPQMPTQHHFHNLHQVIEQVVQLVSINLHEHISIQRDYDPSMPDVKMDTDQVQQAVLNIVQNAIQALEENGGVIRLRTRTRHQMTIGSTRHKLVSELAIIDDGPGVPTELMETLFYPMVTGRTDGTGLGLSIAHNIARLHGGRIDCQSRPSLTIFTLFLPILLP
ncbi:nitrogen regulation protein NR(II) [Parashewanella spongiae]|uniref:Sensory histidine kinase/phosphatase NtrB n=1 Tax=Parashewanella spongiae TaxID=342950 RepID=A0A3A6U651_9GAMM|nr:nitrogen regulation protein NR(II) [Parashewanella spongiae]MCL1078083.1 nitrogen regulation protein NR(II) [Parashewanella spongiae]RJY16956.1 nitrogen regulation protein NR(II) [Parashewanella spongiae]